MPTIGHIFIGIVISMLFYYSSHKKFTFLMGVVFILGGILPDTFTIIRIFIIPGLKIYNSSHGVIAWILWALIFSIILKILIIIFKLDKKIRMKISYIYLILLSAGWMHLGLDMFGQPVRLFWKYYISIFSFYTPYGIMGEQDIIIFFCLFFMLIPIVLLLIVINKVDKDWEF